MSFKSTADDMIQCPYNRTHVVRKQRFPYHLHDCYAKDKERFAICEYNWLHHVPHGTYLDHLQVCEEKIRQEAVEWRDSIHDYETSNRKQGHAEDVGTSPAEAAGDDVGTGQAGAAALLPEERRPDENVAPPPNSDSTPDWSEWDAHP